MTDLDNLITDLRAKAEAATPGPWERRQDPVKYWHAWVEGPSTHPAIPSPDVVCTPAFSDRFHEDDVANMEFIAAANPAAIFTILDALDEARGELERRYDPGYTEDLLRVVSATDQSWREGQAELATLRAEVERLRSVLHKAARAMECSGEMEVHYCPNCDNSLSNARANILASITPPETTP